MRVIVQGLQALDRPEPLWIQIQQGIQFLRMGTAGRARRGGGLPQRRQGLQVGAGQRLQGLREQGSGLIVFQFGLQFKVLPGHGADRRPIRAGPLPVVAENLVEAWGQLFDAGLQALRFLDGFQDGQAFFQRV